MGKVAPHPAFGLLAPEGLQPHHPIKDFKSREPDLDSWLVTRALANEAARTSRTLVVCTSDRSKVAGFYTLALGSIQRLAAPKKLQRNAPDPIPVMVLGRLAVAAEWERKGVGSGLLQDALMRMLQASELAGAAALLAHCKSEQAKVFYHRHGFQPSPLNPLTVMLPMHQIEASARDAGWT